MYNSYIIISRIIFHSNSRLCKIDAVRFCINKKVICRSADLWHEAWYPWPRHCSIGVCIVVIVPYVVIWYRCNSCNSCIVAILCSRTVSLFAFSLARDTYFEFGTLCKGNGHSMTRATAITPSFSNMVTELLDNDSISLLRSNLTYL